MKTPTNEMDMQRMLSNIMNHQSFEMGDINGVPLYLEYIGKNDFCLGEHFNEVSVFLVEKSFDKLIAKNIFNWANSCFNHLKEEMEQLKSIGYESIGHCMYKRSTPTKNFSLWDLGHDTSTNVYDHNGMMIRSKIYQGKKAFEAAILMEKEFNDEEDWIYKNDKLRDLMV